MNVRLRLSQRIHINDIHEICCLVQGNNKRKQELYKLLFEEDDLIGYQAAWVFTHFNSQESRWLYSKQNELIDEVLICRHPGRRRLLLTLLYRQPLATPPRVDFLDFCMARMFSKQELPGIHSLCIKLAYELCRSIPELLQEFKVMLELMEPDSLSVALQTARKNVLKAIQNEKSLQVYK